MTATRMTLAIALATVATPAAIAQTPEPMSGASPMSAMAMPARPVIVPPCAPPREFAQWGQRHSLAAATRIGGDAVPRLALGDSVDLALAPIGSVVLAAPLGKPEQPSDHGGLVGFRATMSGTYRIALGGRVWIDVARDGRSVESVAHAMGAVCSGIAKTVDFRLEPGDYVIQLSAAAAPDVRIAIARLP